MKKLFLLGLATTLAINTSCKKDDDGGNPEQITGSLTVEEGKTQLENNSIDVLNKVEDFKNDNALNEIIALAEFLTENNTDEDPAPFEETVLKTLNNIAEGKDGDFAALNAKQSITILNETPLADEFAETSGIYTWNADSNNFEQTGESDDVVYNIAYDNKTAVFSFTEFETSLNGDDQEELPTRIAANLTINGTQVFSQNYTATFQDGQLIPTTINNTTTIGGFSLNTTYTNTNNTNITQSFDFKLGNDVITGYNYTATGDFNSDLDDDVENIINTIDATFTFINARIKITAKDDNLDSNQELSIDEQVALLNENVDAQLSVNQKLVATAEFYKDEDTYEDFFYNSTTDEFESVEVTDEFLNARFKFEDDTTSDFETYIDGSFTEVENKFESVFEAYEDLFSDVNP